MAAINSAERDATEIDDTRFYLIYSKFCQLHLSYICLHLSAGYYFTHPSISTHRGISTQNAASSVAIQYQRIGEFPLQSRRHSPKRDDRCCEGIEECRDQEGDPELGKAQDLFRGKSRRLEGKTESNVCTVYYMYLRVSYVHILN